ncbi:MAG TPA: hypothetical protein VMV49_01290 [Candidatus Deferrimicrobium sp.]|nr:hypothetical protein [Candidatus Deferrimicrobium sp.]
MKHYITKLIDKVADESTHRRFIKFSKGTFPNGGPVLHVLNKKNVLTINGSFEYEDLIGYFVATHLPDVSYKVTGSIYTQPRVPLDSIQDKLADLSLDSDWERGKRDLKKLYMYPMNSSFSPQEIIQIYNRLSDDCFLLLSITPEKGKDWAVKTDDKIPPLKKTFGKVDPFTDCKEEKKSKCKTVELCEKSGICLAERTKFCKTKTSQLKSDEINDFLNLFLPDYPDTPQSFNELLIVNNYEIADFIFPENKDALSPQELREKIKKVGVIERVIYIDKEVRSNKVEFTS